MTGPRLFPVRLDNEGYRGRAAALWLLGLFLVLRLIMGVNGAINPRAIATGDGLRLDEGGAETILLLFRNVSLANLPLVAIGAVVLWRLRAMVPFFYLVLIVDLVGRRLVSLANPVARTDATLGIWINLALLAILLLGFVLSLWNRRSNAPA